MRDEHAGHVQFIVQAAQPAAQLLAYLGVERAERLVQQQHARLHRQRAGQRDTLALAAGKLGGIAVGQPVELHQFQQRAHLSRICASPGRSPRGFTRRPKATFSNTVMCLNSA